MTESTNRASGTNAPDSVASTADAFDRVLEAAEKARTQGDFHAAILHYEQLATMTPNSAFARYWLATCHEAAGDLGRALEQCELGLRAEPGQMSLLLRMGSVASASHDHRLALDCYLQAAAVDADIPDLDSMTGDQYCFLGRVDEGIASFDRALARNPASTRLQSNRLFVLNYASRLTSAQMFDEHRRWGEAQETAVRHLRKPHGNLRDPERRLKIGYVSGDLRNHAVSYFVEPLLAYHDASRFEVFCFDVSRYAEDRVTARLKAHGHWWRRVADLDDDALAGVVRKEGIDILIDLSGHTEMNRLLTFARKPAPVQATWLGYLGTTGLTEIDYRISDSYLDPPGMTEAEHTETLARLPNAACFAPLQAGPEVGELPASRNGFVTFGSVNQWSKVGPPVLDAWCAILRRTANSRLVAVCTAARNAQFVKEVAEQFERRGVESSRIELQPMRPLREFLDLLQGVDIALDPFPYGGGTTTMHCLWMGVPVIALAGTRAFSRNAVGPLSEVGLKELIATDAAAYIDIACDLAADLERVTAMHQSLRWRMTSSPLMAQSLFARNMETLLRRMWRDYCCAA